MTEPILIGRDHNETYRLPDGFTLKYSKNTIPEPFEGVEVAGPLGQSFADQRMFAYLRLCRYPGGIAGVTLADMDLPQNITDSLYSEVFPQTIREMLRESGLVEKAEGSGLEVECGVSTDKNDILE